MDCFFLSMKMEWGWQRNYANPHEVVADIKHYIVGFYSTDRLHSTLGYRSPTYYEKAITSHPLHLCPLRLDYDVRKMLQ